MAKIKLTRNELKAQREALSRYSRFLPTLELKKLQLETERRKVEKEIADLEQKLLQFKLEVTPWQKMFQENFPRPLQKMVHIEKIITKEMNIAGLNVPVFKDIIFQVDEYDLLLSAPWVDKGIDAICRIIRYLQWAKILDRQKDIIWAELRKTTQRINLFKERLIPECKENIRQIGIHLGDIQAASVGRAKMAKQKLQ